VSISLIMTHEVSFISTYGIEHWDSEKVRTFGRSHINHLAELECEAQFDYKVRASVVPLYQNSLSHSFSSWMNSLPLEVFRNSTIIRQRWRALSIWPSILVASQSYGVS
jgi:hypothetical protein